jgi:hypothetical protein
MAVIVHNRIALIGVVLTLLRSVVDGLLCDVDIVRPKWYEPEYESISVVIRVTTISKTVINGNESFSAEEDQGAFIPIHANSNTPPEPLVQTTEVSMLCNA